MAIEITKMTSRGQVVIPQDIRESKDLKEGEKFIVYDLNDSIILKPVKNLEKVKNIDDFEKIFSSLQKTAKSQRITRLDIKKEIEAYRKENA